MVLELRDFAVHCMARRALVPVLRTPAGAAAEARFVLVLRCGMQFIHII